MKNDRHGINRRQKEKSDFTVYNNKIIHTNQIIVRITLCLQLYQSSKVWSKLNECTREVFCRDVTINNDLSLIGHLTSPGVIHFKNVWSP